MRAIEGTAMIASGQLAHMRLKKKPVSGDKSKPHVQIEEVEQQNQQHIASKDEFESFISKPIQEIESSDSDANLYDFDNWRNKTK